MLGLCRSNSEDSKNNGYRSSDGGSRAGDGLALQSNILPG